MFNGDRVIEIGVGLVLLWILVAAILSLRGEKEGFRPQVIHFPDSVEAYAVWPESTTMAEPWIYVAVRYRSGRENCTTIYADVKPLPMNVIDRGCPKALEILREGKVVHLPTLDLRPDTTEER